MAIGCPDCGALETIPPLAPRCRAHCCICRSPLEQTAGRSVTAALACAATTFLLLIPANFLPLMTVQILGVSRTTVLGSGIVLMWQRGWVILALALGAFGVVLPVIRFALLSFVLAAVRLRKTFRGLGRIYRWAMWLDLWAMPDVFLVGFFVGYSRVAQNLAADIGAGGDCFMVAAVMAMLTRAALDRRTVWRAIKAERALAEDQPAMISCTACDLAAPLAAEGSSCPRCGLRLHARKPDALVRASALTLAGFALYLPANLYPMTISVQAGHEVTHRIVDGIVELFQAGLWPLGILIFCTSIAIPLVKLSGMAWFIASVKLRSRRHLRFKTRLYRLIDELGRWSNMDVFTIVVFVPLIRFDGLASASAAIGAPAFALVVLLTLAASSAFDPRLMWDAAQAP